MTGTVEDGHYLLDFSVVLVMVFSLWEVKRPVMQLQALFRFFFLTSNIFSRVKLKKKYISLYFGFVVLQSGTSTCEHFLGDNAVWRVQEII